MWEFGNVGTDQICTFPNSHTSKFYHFPVTLSSKRTRPAPEGGHILTGPAAPATPCEVNFGQVESVPCGNARMRWNRRPRSAARPLRVRGRLHLTSQPKT